MKNALDVLEENGAIIEYVDPKLPDNILDAAGTYLTALWGTSLKEIARGKEELLCAYTQKADITNEFSITMPVTTKNINFSKIKKNGICDWCSYFLT